MAWDTPDLSSITDDLTDMIKASVNSWPGFTTNGGNVPKFNIKVSGGLPETVRDDGGCQLTLSLMHVGADPTWRNTQLRDGRPLLSPQQPYALVLTYLLTAFADDNFHHEQQAMSIALSCLNAQPIVKASGAEFTVTVEPATLDELARLWQSITVPLRLASLLRVAVVFLSPREQAPTVSPPPRHANLTVAPAPDPLDVVPQLFQASSHIDFLVPLGAGADQVGAKVSPALAVPGAEVVLGGQGLSLPEAAEVYTSTPDGRPR